MGASDEDILELGGQRVRQPHKQVEIGAAGAQRSSGTCSRFLSVWFRCCHVYGRLNRNAEGTAYQGRCPKCGCRAQARIGPGGTRQRMFEAM